MTPSLDDIIDIRNRLYLTDKLVYVVSDQITPGNAIIAKESDMNYEYYLFHSEDEARSVAEQAGLTLLPVRESPRKPLSHMLRSVKLDTRAGEG